MPKVSSLFDHHPFNWGLRGDPFLWDEMQDHFLDIDVPETKDELAELITNAFEQITEHKITEADSFGIERFAHGGMSSGMVCPEFWREKAIPHLWEVRNSLILIVEDGSIVDGANSWLSVENFSIIAQINGIDLYAAPVASVLLESASYLNSLDKQYKGYKVDRNQSMAWPRVLSLDETIEEWHWSATAIPRQVINAQFNVAAEMLDGSFYKRGKPEQGHSKQSAPALVHENVGDLNKVNKNAESRTHINLLLKAGGLKVV